MSTKIQTDIKSFMNVQDWIDFKVLQRLGLCFANLTQLFYSVAIDM